MLSYVSCIHINTYSPPMALMKMQQKWRYWPGEQTWEEETLLGIYLDFHALNSKLSFVYLLIAEAKKNIIYFWQSLNDGPSLGLYRFFTAVVVAILLVLLAPYGNGLVMVDHSPPLRFIFNIHWTLLILDSLHSAQGPHNVRQLITKIFLYILFPSTTISFTVGEGVTFNWFQIL